MVTTRLVGKGRAASPIRPGLITKRVLMGEVPLFSGEYVTEAAIVDLFNAYKGEVARVNALRPRERRIRGMRYSSFYTMFRFAQLKGLVELVREEPMIFPPPHGQLLRIQLAKTKFHVVTSTRKIFRLTEIGKVDEKCWADLTNAYKTQLEPGQKLEYLPPVTVVPVPKKPEVPKPPEVPPATFRPFKWKDTITTVGIRDLIKHLYILRDLGLEFAGVKEEVGRLSMSLADWVIDTEDKLSEARAISYTAAIGFYEQRIVWLNEAIEALEDKDLDTAINLLGQVLRG